MGLIIFVYVLTLLISTSWALYGAKPKEHHWHEVRPLALVNTYRMNCSGFLVTLQWVMTSSHCFFYRPYSRGDIVVRIVHASLVYQGILPHQLALEPGIQIRRASKIIYQEVQNVPDGRGREGALLLMDRPITGGPLPTVNYFQAAHLVRGPYPKSEYLSGIVCHEGGFGFNGSPTILTARCMRVWVNHSKYCREVISYPMYKELCVKRPSGIGLCYGDWGSPILCQNDHVAVAFSWRVLHRNGSYARPYHCARGDVIDVYIYTHAIYRWARYYVKELLDPVYMWVLTRRALPPPKPPVIKGKKGAKDLYPLGVKGVRGTMNHACPIILNMMLIIVCIIKNYC